MKATGIIRRIDELGRIVIPKEIRKNLRIHEGENIEIYIGDNEDVILKKYSLVKRISDVAQHFTDSIHVLLKCNIIVTDTNNVIAFSGPLKKKYIDKELSESLLTSIKRRENILEKHKKELKIIESEVEEGTYVINSILVNGDVVGLVIILSTGDSINETEEKIAHIASEFFTKYLED